MGWLTVDYLNIKEECQTLDKSHVNCQRETERWKEKHYSKKERVVCYVTLE